MSDVAIKLMAGSVGTYQYVVIRQLLSLLLLAPFWLKLPREKRTIRRPGVTMLRALLVLTGSGCAVIAIHGLPLATANAIFYAAPLLMLPWRFSFSKSVPDYLRSSPPASALPVCWWCCARWRSILWPLPPLAAPSRWPFIICWSG
ncbi:hypothetical protein [Dongshaea marina]|uniref:hypothetical protein n=1 Tax=Dongshaea marina TaxID=2047966 RepID=UPI00190259FB|nr:hypothetical protein [Dongshaea marina]